MLTEKRNFQTIVSCFRCSLTFTLRAVQRFPRIMIMMMQRICILKYGASHCFSPQCKAYYFDVDAKLWKPLPSVVQSDEETTYAFVLNALETIFSQLNRSRACGSAKCNNCPKCNKFLNVITFGPKCNKALNVITFGPKCDKAPMQSLTALTVRCESDSCCTKESSDQYSRHIAGSLILISVVLFAKDVG